jgi:hypothetical protein
MIITSQKGNKLKKEIIISTIQNRTTLLLDDSVTSNFIVELSKTRDLCIKFIFYPFFTRQSFHTFPSFFVPKYEMCSGWKENTLKS